MKLCFKLCFLLQIHYMMSTVEGLRHILESKMMVGLDLVKHKLIGTHNQMENKNLSVLADPEQE